MHCPCDALPGSRPIVILLGQFAPAIARSALNSRWRRKPGSRIPSSVYESVGRMGPTSMLARIRRSHRPACVIVFIRTAPGVLKSEELRGGKESTYRRVDE